MSRTIGSHRRSRRIAAAGIVATVLAGTVVAAIVATTQAAEGATCEALFDDFSYTSAADPALAGLGWTVRAGGGGPGVPGVNWSAGNVAFTNVDGSSVMSMTASTDGSASGTTQSEVYQEQKFYEGTYATRMKFSDAPASGSDGDNLVQTFFTITPLDAPMDPKYGEMDFEYLPNGGWGEAGSAFFYTTYETYQKDPWTAVNVYDVSRRSFDGWHDLLAQVSELQRVRGSCGQEETWGRGVATRCDTPGDERIEGS